MKVFKDIFFSLALVLLTVTMARAESNEIPITPVETLSSLLFPNNQRSFFFLTASNENVESNDFYDSTFNAKLKKYFSRKNEALVNSSTLKARNFGLDTEAQEDSRLKKLKRWYEATTHSSSTFTVGFYPYGVT